MISDLERTTDRMSAFRLYVIARIDNEEVEYCPALAMAVQPTSFHVHVLSATYWPKGSISPLVFSSLKLPESMFTVAEEFEKCFHTMEGQTSVLYDAPLSSSGSSKETNQFRTISFLTSKLNTESDVEGEGEEGRLLSSSTHTNEASGRFSSGSAGVSRKRLLWCHGLGTVTLSFRYTASRRSASSMYESSTSSSSTTSLFMTPRTRPSSSSSNSNHAPVKQTISLIVTTPQAAVLLALDTNHHHSSPSSSSFSSLEGKGGLGQNDASMMGGPWSGKESSSGSGPSGGGPPCHHLSERDLSLVTGLHGEELRVVVQSLCDPALPLLQKVAHRQINHQHNNSHNKSNSNSNQEVNRETFAMTHEQGVEWLYRLSDDLLNGSLVGSRDPHHPHRAASVNSTTPSKQDHPLVSTDPSKWSQIMTQLQQTHPASVRAALKTWRESLVDACIVREMKRASREKTGRVSAQINALQHSQWSHPVQESLTLEELATRVKVVLETSRLRSGKAPGMFLLSVILLWS